MLKALWKPFRLYFNFEARTSRAVMHYKDTYFVKVWNDRNPEVYGIGECALFKGLSHEDDAGYEQRLDKICRDIGRTGIPADADSSVRFGLETALADLANGGKGIIRPECEWIRGRRGIRINGLIWMGDRQTMYDRILEKINSGNRCLKLKIGGIDFEQELGLIRFIRSKFGSETLELRLDANGAFTPENAPERLDRLSHLGIHSIEQPIKPGQYDAMSALCRDSSIPVALDEELIGDTSDEFKAQLLGYVRPAYIILKPALCGGLSGADRWIETAVGTGIGWWATSALESNIGLNAIAQWVDTRNPEMPQGLGTGMLYTNNIPSPVEMRDNCLYFNPAKSRISHIP